MNPESRGWWGGAQSRGSSVNWERKLWGYPGPDSGDPKLGGHD